MMKDDDNLPNIKGETRRKKNTKRMKTQREKKTKQNKGPCKGGGERELCN